MSLLLALDYPAPLPCLDSDDLMWVSDDQARLPAQALMILTIQACILYDWHHSSPQALVNDHIDS